MQKSVTLFILIILFSSIFIHSTAFVLPSTPVVYLSLIGSFVLSSFLILLRFKREKIRVSTSEILFLCFGCVVEGCCIFLNQLNPAWLLSLLSLLFLYSVIKRTVFQNDVLVLGIVLLGIAQAVYGLGQYVHVFSTGASDFRIVGSFDNPAGFAAALVAVFPFALVLIRSDKMGCRVLGVIGAIVLMVAIVLSHSRAGMVAVVVVTACWWWNSSNLQRFYRFNKKLKLGIAALLLLGVLAGLYSIKKDSADGRLLIWQCSGQMVLDKPLLGHGIGGFQREYMLYQADFFRQHPTSKFAPLADIVKSPFNEFLLVLVEQGIVGVIFWAVMVYLLIRAYCRKKTEHQHYAAYCLVGIATFACFSYPLDYPFVRLMVVLSAGLLMANEKTMLTLGKRATLVVKPILLLLCIVLLGVSCKLFADEYQWNKIGQRSLNGETQKVLPDYARLYKTMHWNALFLYNYAAELNYIGEWKRSNELMKECAHLYNDNDVQLILADNYQQLKHYREAEKCLVLASEMIPNRFIPLYRRVLLYKEQGQQEKAIQLAKQILRKQVKIPSTEITMIQQGMKTLIENKKSKFNTD